MRTTIRSILAAAAITAALLPMAAVAADPATDEIKTVALRLDKGGERTIAVRIPQDVRYRSNYLRGYVRTFIDELNFALWQASRVWEDDQSPAGRYNFGLYTGQTLTQVRDLDDIAKEEETDPGYMARFRLRETPTLSASKAVREEMKKLLKQERRK